MNREQLRYENQAIQRRYEEKYFPRVAATIKKTVNETMRVIERENNIQAGINHLSKQISNTHLTAIVQGMALEVGLRFARKQWRALQEQRRSTRSKESAGIIEINKKIFFVPYSEQVLNDTKGFGFNDQWVAWIKRYLFDFIVQKITFSVFETTKDTLIRVLSEAISKGWGVSETVKALDELPLPATQAARIVRTEITRAANAGAMAAGETFPFEQSKEWISAHDKRTRGQKPDDHASHIGLDGTVIDYEGVFIDPINGDRLRFPGDPLATAASTVNCRCSIAVVAKIGLNGRLIPKKQNVAA
jgi:arsenate reductase-like glutaredoxin family protein